MSGAKYGTVMVLLKDEGVPYTSHVGNPGGTKYHGIFSPVVYCHSIHDCKHDTTICLQCIESWKWDYEVRFFTNHGDRGYNQGCRCDVCISKRSKNLSAKSLQRAWEVNAKARRAQERSQEVREQPGSTEQQGLGQALSDDRS